ncbi:hypothetical protein BGZ63DRAFT_240465 [Mariannaea sp. PMI_226]|nr:hypothetical protein BGZ63DRAFT_240465 [Mariannaea sp. PMI_226]
MPRGRIHSVFAGCWLLLHCARVFRPQPTAKPASRLVVSDYTAILTFQPVEKDLCLGHLPAQILLAAGRCSVVSNDVSLVLNKVARVLGLKGHQDPYHSLPSQVCEPVTQPAGDCLDRSFGVTVPPPCGGPTTDAQAGHTQPVPFFPGRAELLVSASRLSLVVLCFFNPKTMITLPVSSHTLIKTEICKETSGPLM